MVVVLMPASPCISIAPVGHRCHSAAVRVTMWRYSPLWPDAAFAAVWPRTKRVEEANAQAHVRRSSLAWRSWPASSPRPPRRRTSSRSRSRSAASGTPRSWSSPRRRACSRRPASTSSSSTPRAAARRCRSSPPAASTSRCRTGLLGTIGAYSKKAPIRVISAQMTGAHELYWYVRAESKIRSLKDATEKNTIAFSSPGSSSNLILLALLQAGGLEGEADRDRRASRHAHQRDDRADRHRLGGAAVRAARAPGQEDRHRRARARSDRAPATRPSASTSPTSIRSRPSATRITRLMRVYHEAIEWSYTNPQGDRLFRRVRQGAARNRRRRR